jgi:RNA polymerase sigma-70 factor (ECF subfamily)
MLDDPAPFAEERLKLLFVCAHPVIDATVRMPWMLRFVLGHCWRWTRPARPAN